MTMKERITIWEGEPEEMVFRLVPGGDYRIGSREGNHDEQPVHKVRLSPYYLALTPVTQRQYARLAKACREKLGAIKGNRGERPGQFEGEDHPVESVNCEEVEIIAEELTAMMAELGVLPEGYRVDLPSEAQWEVAYRGGKRGRTDYWNGDGEAALREIGWFLKNSGQSTHPVTEAPAGREKNEQGFLALHGNVYEWTRDEFDEKAYRKRATLGRDPVTLGAAPQVPEIFHTMKEVFRRYRNEELREVREADFGLLNRLVQISKDRLEQEIFRNTHRHCLAAAKTGSWPVDDDGVAED